MNLKDPNNLRFFLNCLGKEVGKLPMLTWHQYNMTTVIEKMDKEMGLID